MGLGSHESRQSSQVSFELLKGLLRFLGPLELVLLLD
jgi:hypothetical protein